MTNLSIETRGTDGADDADHAPAPTPALRFLTDDDLRLLFERAHPAHFVRGDVIIEEGSRRQAIVFVREGYVRVERAHLGRGIAIARCGPGEVLGEMSFVEGSGCRGDHAGQAAQPADSAGFGQNPARGGDDRAARGRSPGRPLAKAHPIR